jgi:hypothetical protein
VWFGAFMGNPIIRLADTLAHRQVGQELADFSLAHFGRVADMMEEDESFDPM